VSTRFGSNRKLLTLSEMPHDGTVRVRRSC